LLYQKTVRDSKDRWFCFVYGCVSSLTLNLNGSKLRSVLLITENEC